MHAVQLFATWKGHVNLFGWQGVAPSLAPEVRGPAAYLFGLRMLVLKEPQKAAELLQTALNNAPLDSPLHQLAAAALASLEKAERS
jgi:hypothetical protein